MLERVRTTKIIKTGEFESSRGLGVSAVELPVAGRPSVKQGDSTAESRLLVINTNLASPGNSDAILGRVWERLKWDRLHTVRELLRSSSVAKLNESRTAKCIWTPVAYVVEHRKIAEKKAYFTGVMTCGVRSICPMCNAKISAWDRDEIQEGLMRIASRGWFVVMVTYTQKHNRFMACGDSLSSLNKAMSRTKSGKRWQGMKRKYGLEGSITALENMYSVLNGHHWHKHVLEVLNRFLTDDEIRSMRDDIAGLYLRELSRLGASADFEVGVDIRRGDDYVAEYVSKFGHEPQVTRSGVSYELANVSGKTKGAEHGHFTMFQLVDLYKQGDELAGRAFLEYAEAVRGRAMLSWSAGLREKLGMAAEVSDDEKIKAGEDESRIFALYHNQKAWPKVRERAFDVLEASRGMEFDAFQEYMKAKGIHAESPVFELVDAGFDGNND